MRIGEVLSLRVQDVNMQIQSLTVHNAKNNVSRHVPMSASLFSTVELYLADISHSSQPSQPLFISLYRRRLFLRRNETYVQKYLRLSWHQDTAREITENSRHSTYFLYDEFEQDVSVRDEPLYGCPASCGLCRACKSSRYREVLSFN